MAVQGVARDKAGRAQRAATDGGVGEQGGAERAAADGLRHVPGAVEVAWREHAVGEHHGYVIGEQQHFARPGVASGGQADQRAFVVEGQGALFTQHADLKAVATCNDAGREGAGIRQPGMEISRGAGQGGTGLPAEFLA